MSQSSAALAAGLSTLLGSRGEVLQFRSGTVTASVTWPKDEEAGVNFSPRRFSRVRLAEAIDPIPEVGEIFTDGNSLNHRIVTVTPQASAGAIVCECEVSE